MDESWILSELVAQVATRIASLPAPSNGQVRAVPDERTVRYYGTIGLLDRPIAHRGRTALYGRKHVAQVVAIKRLQTMGRSLAEIQALWPTLDDEALARMSGVAIAPSGKGRAAARPEFWKREAASAPRPVAAEAAAPVAAAAPTPAAPAPPSSSPISAPIELRLELAPGVSLAIAMSEDIALSTADVRAIRAAAAPLVTELARCRLVANAGGEEP
ncbi:MAG: MerR family transcriptional regulator [Kofleriaceae bacterium]